MIVFVRINSILLGISFYIDNGIRIVLIWSTKFGQLNNIGVSKLTIVGTLISIINIKKNIICHCKLKQGQKVVHKNVS